MTSMTGLPLSMWLERQRKAVKVKKPRGKVKVVNIFEEEEFVA